MSEFNKMVSLFNTVFKTIVFSAVLTLASCKSGNVSDLTNSIKQVEKANVGNISMKINKKSFLPNSFSTKGTTTSNIVFLNLAFAITSTDASVSKTENVSFADGNLAKSIKVLNLPVKTYNLVLNLNYTENDVPKNISKNIENVKVEGGKLTEINENLEVTRTITISEDTGSVLGNIGVNVIDKVVNVTSAPITSSVSNSPSTSVTSSVSNSPSTSVTSSVSNLPSSSSINLPSNTSATSPTSIVTPVSLPLITGEAFANHELSNNAEIISVVKNGSNVSLKKIDSNSNVLAENNDVLNDPNSPLLFVDITKMVKVFEDGSNLIVGVIYRDKNLSIDSNYVKIFVLNKTDLKVKTEFTATSTKVSNNGEFEICGKNGKYTLFFSPDNLEVRMYMQKFNTAGVVGNESYFYVNSSSSKFNLVGAFVDPLTGIASSISEWRNSDFYRSPTNLNTSTFSISESAFKNDYIANNGLTRVFPSASNVKTITKNDESLYVSDVFSDTIDVVYSSFPVPYSDKLPLVFYQKDKDGLQSRIAQTMGNKYLAVVYSSQGSEGKKDGLYLSVINKSTKSIVSNTFIQTLNQVNSYTNLESIAMDNNDNIVMYYTYRKNSPKFELKTVKYDINGNIL